MRLSLLVKIFVSFLSPLLLLGESEIEKARELWKKGNYREAGEILWKVIEEQKEEIENQRKIIRFYREELKRVEKEKKEVERGVEIATANLEAGRLYREGWKWQHRGIFEAKNEKEKREALLKAIEIFREIVIRYPYSEKADDAQYRIGRIYFAFLKEYGKAEMELRKLIENYPESEYVEKAKEMLERLK
ncbi:MAG TPA: tetratricopeptide repeat protein [bacterium]|nr:tetratricopeptide repeat protein [bacterium]HEX68471.1 tetratricopeptide repeat protein [bacterium]